MSSRSRSPRVVVVTGASSGIGLATCLAAARTGDHVVLAARDEASLQAAAVRCGSAGAASTTVIPTDVGDDPSVAALVDEVVRRHGHLDVVVNSAGVVSYGRVEDVPVEVFEKVIRTNLVGSVNVSRHVMRVFRRQRSGTLVLVGSVIGHIAVPRMGPYVVSKWGVRALARQLQVENRGATGIQVRYVAPGGVDTPIYQQAGNVAGFEGRPPPPVSSPERVARQIFRRIDHRFLPDQLSVANDVIRLGFSALPAVYDALVDPLFTVGATDLTRPVEPGSGNVLEAKGTGNGLHGDQGNALVGIGHNLVRQARRLVRR